MAKFNIFINGIQKNQRDNAEKIKEEARLFLNFTPEKIEQIFSSSKNTCIKKGASEEEAQTYQQTLQKIGIICIYSPGSEELSFSLEDMIVEDIIAVENCPSCHEPIEQENTPQNSDEPKKCPHCYILIEKFLQLQKVEEEKADIKKRLLRTQTAKQSRKRDDQAEKIEHQRQKELEQEVKDELEIKNDHRPLIIAGLLLSISGGAFYYSLNATPTPASKNDEQIAAVNANNSAPPTNTTHSTPANTAPQSGQAAMQDTHDKAAKFLKGFGLDADALANQDGDEQTVHTQAAESLSQFDTQTLASTSMMQVINSPNSSTTSKTAPINNTQFLLNFNNDNQAWDYFLTQQCQQWIQQNKPIKAYQLSLFLSDTKLYIDILGEILINTQNVELTKKINTILLAKIKSLPLHQQVEFLIQADTYYYQVTKSHRFLEHGEYVWNELTSAAEQLHSGLQLAVAYAKNGNNKAANTHFKKIKPQLSKINSSSDHLAARIAIAKTSYNTNKLNNALKWLKKAEKYLANANNISMQKLIKGYVYIKNIAGITRIIQKIKNQDNQDNQDNLLLFAIKEVLQLNFNDEALTLQSTIKNPIYQALSHMLLTQYKVQNINLAETIITKKINKPIDKAIMFSYLAQQYSLQGNLNKVTELLQKSKNQLNSIPASTQKDTALQTITLHYVRSTFNTAIAKDFLSMVKSPTIKNNIQQDIHSLSKVIPLLNH